MGEWIKDGDGNDWYRAGGQWMCCPQGLDDLDENRPHFHQPELWDDTEWPIETEIWLYHENELMSEFQEQLNYSGDLPKWWVADPKNLESLIAIESVCIKILVNQDGSYEVKGIELG